MENWLWLLILIFFVFRLLLKAGKKIGQTPPSRQGAGKDRPPPAPERREAIWERREEEEEPQRTDFRNPLLKVLEEMAGVQQPQPIIPPPPPGRIVRETKMKAPENAAPPPKEVFTLPEPPPEESTPREERLVFSSHPVLQGIILSEVLGPPLAFRDAIKRP